MPTASLKPRNILMSAFAAGVLLLCSLPDARAETVPNPLRPKAEESRRPAATPRAVEPRAAERKPAESAGEAAKPKRERSAKQRENDEMMRACGATWRAEKAALQEKGETWRSFLKDCRAKKKAETPV